MKVNGKTKLACLIGHPVSHSFSPYIHNYLAEKYDLNLKYVCFDVEPCEVGEALNGFKALGIVGSNVTIPHKLGVMGHLDEVDKNAAIIGAVNTIKNEGGRLIGYNTDGAGFVKSVLDEGHEIKGKHVMILGAGGASRAIAIELASRGAAKVTIRNNTMTKAEQIAEAVTTHFKGVQAEVGKLNIKEADLREVDILINTTPLGMGTKRELCPIDESIVPHEALVVCDIVYTPHDTRLLKWAESHKLAVVHGIGMLINQALKSFSIWTGIEAEVYEEVIQVLKEEGVLER